MLIDGRTVYTPLASSVFGTCIRRCSKTSSRSRISGPAARSMDRTPSWRGQRHQQGRSGHHRHAVSRHRRQLRAKRLVCGMAYRSRAGALRVYGNWHSRDALQGRSAWLLPRFLRDGRPASEAISSPTSDHVTLQATSSAPRRSDRRRWGEGTNLLVRLARTLSDPLRSACKPITINSTANSCWSRFAEDTRQRSAVQPDRRARMNWLPVAVRTNARRIHQQLNGFQLDPEAGGCGSTTPFFRTASA